MNSTIPRKSVTGVETNKGLSATFTEAMDPSTISETTFTLSQGRTPVSGVVSYFAGRTATFMPRAPLAPNTAFTAAITTGAQDMAGNAMAAARLWRFTTGAATDGLTPTVSSVSPVDETMNVPVTTTLVAIFNEAMAPATMTTRSFTLKQGTTPVVGVVTYYNRHAGFAPVASLLPETRYTATVTTESTGLAGNPVQK